VIGAVAASWKGIDGLVVATGFLLVIGIAALLNLRAHEGAVLDGLAGRRGSVSISDSIRDTLVLPGGEGKRPAEPTVEE
jgi:hypothetical protein